MRKEFIPKTYGLTHLTISVNDLSKTRDFYCHIFDMEIMYEEDKMLQLTTKGNHDILVFEEKKVPDIGHSGGIAHFGFRLRDPDDVDEIYNRVMEMGAEVVDKGSFVPGSPFIFFKDPDGYLLEVWYEMIPER